MIIDLYTHTHTKSSLGENSGFFSSERYGIKLTSVKGYE